MLLIFLAGETVHKGFGLGIVNAETISHFTQSSAEVEELRTTNLIIWDEISMCHVHLFHAVDRSLCDLLDSLFTFISRFEAVHFPWCYLVGDSGYKSERYMMVPLSDVTSEPERLYNESQIRTRKVGERLVRY